MKKKGSRPLKANEKQELFTEMYTLLDAGLDFSGMFGILSDGNGGRGSSRAFLKDIYADIVKGGELHEAMEKTGLFSAMDCNVVRIGESSGRLEYTLDFLAGYYLKKEARRKTVRTATGYPLTVLCFAVVVLIFMMTVIIPMFGQIYERMGQELPALTGYIIGISESFPAFLAAASFMSVTLLVLYRLWKDRLPVLKARSLIMLKTPLAGDIVRLEVQSTFCKMMSLLSMSGIPILDALEMVSSAMPLYDYGTAISDISQRVRYGDSLSGSLSRYPGLFCDKLRVMVRVGEECNRLPDMFSRAGDILSDSLDYKLKNIGTYIEPALILFVGLIVSVILISMYLPMFRMGLVITA